MTENTQIIYLRIKSRYMGKYYGKYLDAVGKIWGKPSFVVLHVISGFLQDTIFKLNLPLGGEGKGKDIWKVALKVILWV